MQPLLNVTPAQLKNGTDESNLSSVQTINIFQHLEFHSSNFDWLRSTQIDSDWLRLSKHPFRSSPPVQSFIASVMAASWSFRFDGVAMVSSVALMRKASSGLEACWDGPNRRSTWDDLRFCWLAPLICVKCWLERSKPRHEWHQMDRHHQTQSRLKSPHAATHCEEIFQADISPLFLQITKHVLGEIAMFGGDLPRFRCLNPVISVLLLRLWLPFLTPSEVFEPLQTNLNHLLKRCFWSLNNQLSHVLMVR